MVRNAGMTAKGSTRKKMEVNAISENLTTEARLGLMGHLDEAAPQYTVIHGQFTVGVQHHRGGRA
jgi:hypothetical protein